MCDTLRLRVTWQQCSSAGVLPDKEQRSGREPAFLHVLQVPSRSSGSSRSFTFFRFPTNKSNTLSCCRLAASSEQTLAQPFLCKYTCENPATQKWVSAQQLRNAVLAAPPLGLLQVKVQQTRRWFNICQLEKESGLRLIGLIKDACHFLFHNDASSPLCVLPEVSVTERCGGDL